MKYYKVVDDLYHPITLDTAQANYSNSFPDADFHNKFLQVLTDLSRAHKLPLDLFINLNNNLAIWGEAYLQNFPPPVNGYFNLANLTKLKTPGSIGMLRSDFEDCLTTIVHNGVDLFLIGTYLWEYLFEKVRQTDYEALPSRTGSLFLFENIADCNYYKDKHREGYGTVCEVELLETRALFRADMSLIDEVPLFSTYQQAIDTAGEYWSLKNSKEPINEILFQGRCKLTPLP